MSSLYVLVMARLDRSRLHAQRHDGIDDVRVVLLQRLNSLLPRYARLSHDQLDVLRFNASIVHLLPVIFLLFFLAINAFDSLVFFVMFMAGMRVRTLV